jgi:mannobiose 2-epimerase
LSVALLTLNCLLPAGGYNTLTSNQIPSTLAKRDPPTLVPTTLNDVLHGMEALAQLYKVDQSNLVKARLLELLRLLCVDLVVQGRLLSEYHPPGSAGQAWVPIDGAILDYGHNIEASWLINDALGVLEAAGSIDAAVLQQYRAAAFALGAKAAAEGWDGQHGGLFLLGAPGQAPSSTEKVWWVQAEAAVAFWDLHHLHNSQAGYLQKLSDTVNFITKHLNDPVHGEWVWQVAADGAALDNFSPGLNTKGNEWKASYHTLRMLLELQRRL